MEEKLINRAIKIRLYPTLEQQTFLNKSFGCARFFYNFLLNECTHETWETYVCGGC